jgi:putative PIN family toxin of toxin-antitoxin system
MKKVVLDTNVMVSAMLSPGGNPAVILTLILDGKLQICHSPQILAEYEDVLLRPDFNFDPQLLRIILDSIAEIGVSSVPESSISPIFDESDRIFYDLAKTTHAFLVTGIVKHYRQAPFVVTPGDFAQYILKTP